MEDRQILQQMDNLLNCLVKDLRFPSLCGLWQGLKLRSWTTLTR